MGDVNYIDSKTLFITQYRSRADLFIDNFIPFHSYVLDRDRIPPHLLEFDETLDRLEDYEFLVKLAVSVPFDFKNQGHPVCEYRIRDDGSNTVVDLQNRTLPRKFRFVGEGSYPTGRDPSTELLNFLWLGADRP